MDPRKDASETIKNLMMSEKRSRLPLVLGIGAALLVAGAVGYWFYLPLDERPSLDQLKARAIGISNSILNTSISGAPATPTTSDSKNHKPDTSSEDVHLLSN